MPTPRSEARAERVDGSAHHHRDVDRLAPDRQPARGPSARARAGRRRAVRAGPPPPRRCGARARAPPTSRTPQGEVELGLQVRQRGAELVARVVDEPPLALDRLLEPVQHRVQRLGQARELVAGPRDRQPAPGVAGRDRGRLAARIDRPVGGSTRRAARSRRRQGPARAAPRSRARPRADRASCAGRPATRPRRAHPRRRPGRRASWAGTTSPRSARGPARRASGRRHRRTRTRVRPRCCSRTSTTEPSGAISCANDRRAGSAAAAPSPRRSGARHRPGTGRVSSSVRRSSGLQPQVDEDAGGRQDDRHQDRRDQRHPGSEPHQPGPARSRYPRRARSRSGRGRTGGRPCRAGSGRRRRRRSSRPRRRSPTRARSAACATGPRPGGA